VLSEQQIVKGKFFLKICPLSASGGWEKVRVRGDE